MTFILLLIIFFILWPVLRTGWRIWSQMRSMRRFMADPMAEMNRHARQQRQRQGYSSGQQSPRPAKKKKKIARDVGEYVEYTEIEVSQQQHEADSRGSQTKFRREEQISDISWVDIK